jgi:hypothetical protein
LLRSGPPAEPSSPEFAASVAAAGKSFGAAGVVGVYLVHGTFAGNDALGLLTELARFAPGVSESLRKLEKSAVDALVGESGNYTPEFTARFEELLTEGAGRPIPVRLFNWSSQNNHIGRADGAVRLLDELANFAERLPAYVIPPAPSPRRGGSSEHGRQWRPSAGAAAPEALERGERASADESSPPIRHSSFVIRHSPSEPGDPSQEPAPRLLLFAHSHGGNVCALMSHLLGGDDATRHDFFHAARTFYRSWLTGRVDLPVWQRAQDVLANAAHPLRQMHFDIATFGTPVRYGWETGALARLIHFVNHRPSPGRHEHRAAYPILPWRMLAAHGGDYVQQIGIAGSGLPPNFLAPRTVFANWRLRRLFHRGIPFQWLTTRLKHGRRVHDDGTTLLIDYEDPETSPLRHFFGHAVYTRSRWLPLHCETIARHFYGNDKSLL